MNKIKFLNAFAGFGGNTELLDREKFHVTHIENNDERIKYLSKNFREDSIIFDDAYESIVRYFRDYDIIWASVPCQTHSRTRIMQLSDRYENGNFKLPDFRLYELITFLKHFASRKIWIVENVFPYYEPLIKPTAKVGRHLFWSNKYIENKKFKADNIQDLQHDSIERNRMNPEIGLYTVEQATMYQQQTLEDYHE